MRDPRRSLPALGLVLLAGCGDEPDAPPEARAEDTASSTLVVGPPLGLVPRGTVAFLTVPDPERFEAATREVLGLFSDEPPPFPLDAPGLLARAGAPGNLDLLDAERPVAVALRLDPGLAPAFLLPVTDGPAFAAGIAGDVPVHLQGGYALVGAEPGASRPSAWSSRPGGELLALRVDLEACGPLLTGALEGAAGSRPEPAPGGFDPEILLRTLRGFLEEVLASTTTLDVTLVWAEGRLGLEARIELVPGSALDGWIGAEPTGAAELAAALDPDAAMMMVGGVEPAVLRDHLLPRLRELFEGYPASMRDPLVASMAEMERHYEHVGGAFAGTQDLGPDGLRYTYVLESTDADAYLDGMLELFASPEYAALGYRPGEPVEERREGTRVVRVPLTLDLEAMLAAMGGEAKEEERRAFAAVMGSMFGEDSELVLGAREGLVAGRLGPGPSMSALLDGARAGGPPPPGLAPLLERRGDDNPLLVGRLDLADLLREVLLRVGESSGEDLPRLPDDLTVELTFHAAGHGDRFHSGLDIDLAALARMIEALNR